MEEKKVRVCKKCGTEVRTISDPKDIEKTELANDSTWGLVSESEAESFDLSKGERPMGGGGPEISRIGKGGGGGHWSGQFHCPKCDKSAQNFVDETQTELKKIEGVSREEEIELSRKAKEEVEEQKSSVIWGDEEEPGKGWND